MELIQKHMHYTKQIEITIKDYKDFRRQISKCARQEIIFIYTEYIICFNLIHIIYPQQQKHKHVRIHWNRIAKDIFNV